MTRSLGSLFLASVVVCAPARGQEREDVLFQLNPGPLAQGHSVFVLGDLPELGANDLIRAVKLADTGTGWQVSISLPVNASYTFRFYDRAHGEAQIADPMNGAPLGASQGGSTSVVQLAPTAKRALYHTDFTTPQLFWRQGSGGFAQVAMARIGPGRTGSESLYEVAAFAAARQSVEFYVTDVGQTRRDPATGTYETPLDAFFLQDGHLFTYVPAASVAPHRRDYNPASPPLLASAVLGENRPYRVMLPRGYDQHTTRRYPVLYAHDGWLWFDSAATSIDEDARNLAELTRLGKAGEMIVVGVGHEDRTNPQVFWTKRFRDFTPPGDWGVTPFGLVRGEADKYLAFILTELKPHIDATYRTRRGRDTTWSAGFSAGGVVSLYSAWDFASSFGRSGSFSGAFEVPNFVARVASEPKRSIRIYLDAGTVNDYYPHALGLYDDFARRASPWTVERDLRFAYGAGHQHNTGDVGKRFPGFVTFLYPGTEERNENLCGAVPYDTGLGGGQTLTLGWTSSGGPTGILDVTGGGPGSPGLLGFSVAPDRQTLLGLPVLIWLGGAITIPIAFDASGRAPTPFDLRLPSIAGLSLYTQAFELRAGSAFVSGGLELLICR